MSCVSSLQVSAEKDISCTPGIFHTGRSLKSIYKRQALQACQRKNKILKDERHKSPHVCVMYK